MEELTGLRRVTSLKRDAQGAYWAVDLRPYDLVAVRLSTPEARLFRPQVLLPEKVASALQRRIYDLGDRAASLRNAPLPLSVLSNPGFERPRTGSHLLPGWLITQRPEVAIGPDATERRGGQQSVKMTTTGPWACLESQRFDPPATGRLRMSVWMKTADAAEQPAMRLAIPGELNVREYYRLARF